MLIVFFSYLSGYIVGLATNVIFDKLFMDNSFYDVKIGSRFYNYNVIVDIRRKKP